MTTTKKKRGRPPKKRPEQTPEYWEKQLHNHRLGMHRAVPKWQVLGCQFVNEEGETFSLESIIKGGNITCEADRVAVLHQQRGADESIVLPAPWLRSLEYMDFIAELQSPQDQGAALKKLLLEDARSRCGEEQPIDFSCAGTPAEFRQRCAENRLEIELDSRRHIIKISAYSLSPDEP
jgi:hypothetical protein